MACTLRHLSSGPVLPWIPFPPPSFSPAASFPPRVFPVRPDSGGSLPAAFPSRPERFPLPKASAAAAAAKHEGPKWWERKTSPNMIDIHSTEEFLDALSQAEDKLVVVEFYGTWCASCRAMFPKFCRTAKDNADVLFLKVDFDENKPMCERLNVKVVPYFHFYRGAEGKLEAFTCSLPKFQKIKDAIAIHNTARCSIGPPVGVGDVDLLAELIPDEILTEADSV